MARSIDFLRHEQRILEVIEVLKKICQGVRRGEPIPSDHALTLVDYFRTVVDREHHVKEESTLFPALVRAGILSYNDQIEPILFEHNQGQSLVDGIEDAVRRNDCADFLLSAEQMIDLQADHISKEEHVLFPIARRLLDPAEDDRIMKDFTRADEWFGEDRRQQYDTTIRDLERAYAAPDSKRVAGDDRRSGRE